MIVSTSAVNCVERPVSEITLFSTQCICYDGKNKRCSIIVDEEGSVHFYTCFSSTLIVSAEEAIIHQAGLLPLHSFVKLYAA